MARANNSEWKARRALAASAVLDPVTSMGQQSDRPQNMRRYSCRTRLLDPLMGFQSQSVTNKTMGTCLMGSRHC
ncbi:hypothetical protein IF1G_11182 [Cordyceps javanica]|uniref:Uncharacterized protein n=1 Tax=Cordyceps javanica TaxID=43265 RepID=A0A545UL03_9HYPO|nr:hypothetical protein IF1G_11182 [Cordyceps javanica]